MTTPKSSTEQDAHVSLIHAIAHYGQFPTPENHRVYADCIDAYAEAVRAAERARLIGDVDIERASDCREYLLRHAVPCVIADSFRGDFAEMVGKEVEARWRELFAKRGLTEDTAR